ncbi:hypothetical protein SCOCK_690003 [Actinacidiphila cocklensis]|uniref:Uncharacterized protein n=1 Tax=Actinacidiphila cocklensis TaxID=887465 RepID=A0A9W4DY45_9ACTN|nr:hypothetical protein SCOCK_690003 [Actinacidiphila cocklensis]
MRFLEEYFDNFTPDAHLNILLKVFSIRSGVSNPRGRPSVSLLYFAVRNARNARCEVFH